MERYGFHSLDGKQSVFVLAKNADEARVAKNRIVQYRRDNKARAGFDRPPCDDEQPEGPIVIDSLENLYQ